MIVIDSDALQSDDPVDGRDDWLEDAKEGGEDRWELEVQHSTEHRCNLKVGNDNLGRLQRDEECRVQHRAQRHGCLIRVGVRGLSAIIQVFTIEWVSKHGAVCALLGGQFCFVVR